MAGITDRSFRTLCGKFGADFSVTEMVSAKAVNFGDRKTAEIAETGGEGRVSVQIFGSDPDIMANAAWIITQRAVERHTPLSSIDINMGCPMKKIVSNGEGSALMRNPELIFRIVSAVKNATELPVSVKLRTGWDHSHINAAECALAAVSGGAAAITVHGRTKEQLYAPPVDYDTIASVKKAVGSVTVIGNGGITDTKSALRMLETGVDGIMIGQGAIGKPWIFSEIKAGLSGLGYREPDVRERLAVAKEQLLMMAELKSEYAAVHEGRRHLMWYVKGIRGAAAFRDRLCESSSLDEIFKALDRLSDSE